MDSDKKAASAVAGAFLNIGAITPLGAAPASFAQQCPRCDNSSSEVGLHNSVTLGGVVLGMMKLWRPYDQSCNLGRAAENNVGPEDRVLDMRDMWSSYDQSCILGGAARKRAGRGVHVWKMSMS